MSGDVQPRKRKDKKKKKDELGVEEPRGTAAALGEGDVFLHSHQDHSTGGHWCAKIIFFSLLAVLITLIGLIILENRGLSELEANSVESRYSGVLEGWLEDATDDDHHDVHTLELKHHDDDDDEHGHDDEEHQINHDDDDDHNENEENDDFYDDDEHADHEDEEHDHDDHYEDEQDQEDEEGEDSEGDDDDEDRNVDAADEEEEDVGSFRKYFGFGYGGDEENTEAKPINEDENKNDDIENENTLSNEKNNEDVENDGTFSNEIKNDDFDIDDPEENEDNHELNEDDDLNTENESFENFDDDDDTLDDYNEKEDDDHDEDEDDVDEDNTEVERIEREVSQEEPISMELPALPEDGDDDDEEDTDQDKEDDDDEEPGDDNEPDDDDKDDDFLEADDEPPVERITAPSGRPFDELEDEEVFTEKPPDTLEEEEEYEKKQEELRQEQEQSSHMWLKLIVGMALLAATHAVMRRATAPSDGTESEEHVSREETPVVDRRMTLIPVPEEPLEPEVTQKASKFKPVQEVLKKSSTVLKYAPPPKEESDEEDQEAEEIEQEEQEKDEEKELFSEEEPEDDPEQEDEIMQARKETPKKAVPTVHEPTPDDELGDDVEIIDEDQLEEELDDEEDDEDISDVDDAELLTRLEAKYGRLPEPDRPAPRHKDGGNSIEEEWPDEPSDPYWRQQLDSAERHLRQGEYAAATQAAGAPQLAASARARWLIARALDAEAEARRDNRVLTRAIAAYMDLLKMNERLSDKKLLEIANRTLERIQFRGNYLSAEPVYRLLIRRFPDDVTYRNKLTVSYLMANRPDLADEVLKETLRLWPNDLVALAHYGFVLKTQHNKLEKAVVAFQKALEGDQGPACEPRFYYHLGDALLMLGRFPEAHEVHKRGAKLGHFLSPAQRSLYNVPRLMSKPWWNVEDTPYVKLARSLEKSWREILKEGLAAQVLYEKEKEGLKERGEWSQLDLFVRGQEIPGRCKQAPVTCSVVKAEVAAAGCRRGQVKFSAMEPGTHVRPHVGPTNCRLRMHLGLSNTKHTYLRVDQETRQWQEGKVLLFDDSFEHEVWHNGTGARLVLIVDVWHPHLTHAERSHLPAI